MKRHLTFGMILICLILSCKSSSKFDVVKVSGRHIMLNDKIYLIKGICYNPVPKGSNDRSFQTLAQDLALMEEASINTIRLYQPIDDKNVLDQINKAGMKVIIGFGYNQNGVLCRL